MKDKRREVDNKTKCKSEAKQKASESEKNVNEGLAVVAGGAGKDPRGEVGER